MNDQERQQQDQERQHSARQQQKYAEQAQEFFRASQWQLDIRNDRLRVQLADRAETPAFIKQAQRMGGKNVSKGLWEFNPEQVDMVSQACRQHFDQEFSFAREADKFVVRGTHTEAFVQDMKEVGGLYTGHTGEWEITLPDDRDARMDLSQDLGGIIKEHDSVKPYSIVPREDKILVRAPECDRFAKDALAMGGTFQENTKTWRFPKETLSQVRAMAAKHFPKSYHLSTNGKVKGAEITFTGPPVRGFQDIAANLGGVYDRYTRSWSFPKSSRKGVEDAVKFFHAKSIGATTMQKSCQKIMATLGPVGAVASKALMAFTLLAAAGYGGARSVNTTMGMISYAKGLKPSLAQKQALRSSGGPPLGGQEFYLDQMQRQQELGLSR